jgi:hypothetical protein
VIDYDLQPISLSAVRCLCEQFHGYGSAGGIATYSWGVYEGNSVVAAYAWQPPAPGAAAAVCPEAPQGVLALSRMVAVPRSDRQLNHVSRPLRRQMKRLIDRTRWPVLITYSDEGQGHAGHVYKCSGWTPTTRETRPFFVDANGKRASSYSNGKHGGRGLKRGGTTVIQRWEHWTCERGKAGRWMASHGWRREPIPGKVWRSGNQAYRFIREAA